MNRTSNLLIKDRIVSTPKFEMRTLQLPSQLLSRGLQPSLYNRKPAQISVFEG
jgi:hypothetical protein